MPLKEYEHNWGLWAIWRATDRRYLPSQLEHEDERTLAVFLELDGLYEKIARQMAEQEKQQVDANTGALSTDG